MAKSYSKAKNLVTDSKLELKGRKKLMAESGMELLLTARAPLTEQLFATLTSPDSMVVIPLGKRNKAVTIFNLQQKAARAKATLRHHFDPTTKTVYAWLEKKGPANNPTPTNGESLGTV